MKLPNFEQFLDNLWPAESEREKDLCGMNKRTLRFAFTTYSADVLWFCYWEYESQPHESQAKDFQNADEGVLAGIYCRFHWRQWEKLGWRMANNCTITALCWMIKLSSQTRQEVGGRGDLWKVMQSFLLAACLWKVVAKAENNPAFKRNDWERFVFFCCLLSIHFWIVCVLKACINQFSYFFL